MAPDRESRSRWMTRILMLVWAVILIAEVAFSVAYSYRIASEQPRWFAKAIKGLRICVFALAVALLYLLATNEQVLTGLVVLSLTIACTYLALHIAYAKQVRLKAARMTDLRDPLELQRYRRTAKWMIYIEVKEGRRAR